MYMNISVSAIIGVTAGDDTNLVRRPEHGESRRPAFSWLSPSIVRTNVLRMLGLTSGSESSSTARSQPRHLLADCARQTPGCGGSRTPRPRRGTPLGNLLCRDCEATAAEQQCSNSLNGTTVCRVGWRHSQLGR